MPKVLVGMWSKDGYTKCSSDEWKVRFSDLQKQMIVAFAMGPKTPPADALHVFLAPEYYFRKDRNRSQTDGRVTAYSKDEFTEICNALKAQSRTLRSLLLIGGSVMWISDERKRRVRHTVPIYHDGREVLLYDKRNDCLELAAYERNLGFEWKPGTVSGSFTIGGLKCGIETCVDQDKGELRKLGTDFDLHIIISNTVTVTKPAIKAGGFLLHCNAVQNDRPPPGNYVYGAPFSVNNLVNGQHKGLTSFFSIDL